MGAIAQSNLNLLHMDGVFFYLTGDGRSAADKKHRANGVNTPFTRSSKHRASLTPPPDKM